MPQFLIFHLWGPLSSWGTLAVGDIRPGQAHPTRSALLGLLAGALGLRREEHERHGQLARGLGLAVLVRRRGMPLTDFHTVEVPRRKKNATYATRREELAALDEKDNPIVSRRDYRQDACYSIGAWQSGGEDGALLQRLARALDSPGFVPCLGRKSCPPGFPLSPGMVEADNLLAAFDLAIHKLNLPADWPLAGPGKELFWDLDPAPAPVGLEPQEIFTRRDQPTDRLRWLFALRREAWASLKQEMGG